jgi:hypothetical protein
VSCLTIKQGHRILSLDVGVFSRKLNNEILNVIHKFLSDLSNKKCKDGFGMQHALEGRKIRT